MKAASYLLLFPERKKTNTRDLDDLAVGGANGLSERT